MADPVLDITTSRQFPAWLAERRCSLAFTTYQAGKLFLIGLKPDGRLSVSERTFERCMGLAVAGPSLWMATLWQLWRFENTVPPGGATADGYDALYVPRVAWVTGDLDVHDVAIDAEGRPIFANTLFSCLATTSETASFVPLWRPPFISRLAAEDRCHLNGLAVKDGRAAQVTAVSRSDSADGWRERRQAGGVLVDVATGEVLCDGLSMPHSPRWHRDRLWMLNSGRGEFGWVDLASGRFEPLAFIPGYGRGLAFVDDFAIVGASKPRDNRTFSGLPLQDELARRDVEPRCGLFVVDLRSGDVVHWLRLEGVVEELYDVALLAGVRRPHALGIRNDEIRRVITIG